MSEHFSKILKEYRLRKDLSLRNLAKLVNVSFSYISKLEKAQYNPSKKVVIDLAQALGAPKEKFLAAAGYLPENDLPPESPHTEEEAKVLSFLRRIHPHIVELIEKASELPEDQQELIAVHWKWALDVVRRQEAYKIQKNDQLLRIAEKEAGYRADLEELVPRNEINLAKAMVKISNIVYEHNLTKEEATYLMHQAVDYYGKPEFPEETYVAAHGPRVPGQIGREKEEED